MKCQLYYILIILLLGCHDDDSPSAESFLNQMLTIMENNSINKHTIDWPVFRAKVIARVSGARTIEDTYPGISEALTMLGDNHSVFVKPDGRTIYHSTIHCTRQATLMPALPANVAYVKVNAFSGTEAEGTAFSKEIQEQIKSQDNANIVGWIVDLRSNGGGNMWPMLAGIGSVLGEGISGYFIDADDVEAGWGYKDGAALSVGVVVANVTDPYELLVPNPKVAVLLDNGVASSGEVMAISFIGKANTRSFGSPTCGLSTSNSTFTLDGGHTLYLTTGYLADRN